MTNQKMRKTARTLQIEIENAEKTQKALEKVTAEEK